MSAHPTLVPAALFAAFAAGTPASFAQCDYAWQDGYAYTDIATTIFTAEVLDHGGGERLYVGGNIETITGQYANDFAYWDGDLWHTLPGPAVGPFSGENPVIFDLLAWDDGSGPALYAGGAWDTIGASLSRSVARWDGSQWTDLGAGVNFDGFYTGIVRTLAVFDDSSGPALFVGGSFNQAGSVAADNIAKWDGSTWSALGSGVAGTVKALAVYDDGSGPALYAAGTFSSAGGNAASNIAKWDGATWSAVGAGVDSSANALAVFDDGGGETLFVGGSFQAAGGLPASRIARWDGGWSDVAGGVDSTVDALKVLASVTGPVLYVGGSFTTAGTQSAERTAQWDGAAWRQVGGGTNGAVNDFALYDDGSGEPLVSVGVFTTAGGVPSPRIARKAFTGTWQPLIEGDGFDGTVQAMKVWDDGSGPALYVAGQFTTVGGMPASRIARYDGVSWTPLGSGLNGTVYDLEAFDDGSGEQLYVGGFFTSAGGSSANRLARWNGSAWSSFGGSGANGAVYDLLAWDGLGGNALYVGGAFGTIDGTPSGFIARWDGSAWTPMPGLAGGDGGPGVRTMVGWDEGLGPHLYVGGHFYSAGGIQTGGHAKWDGAAWSAIPARWNGNTQRVEDMTVWDDGTGESLYYAGNFSYIGPIQAFGAARYDGTLWLPLGYGVGAGYDYFAWDAGDGLGEQLYLGGVFQTAGLVPASNIARWNGTAWSALGTGVGGTTFAMEAYDDGSAGGESLFVGGAFVTAGGLLSGHIAEWQRGCAVANFCDTSPNSAGPGAVMGSTGSTSIAANDFTLVATGAPPSQFGLYYYGPQPENVPFGDGIRCVGGQTFRLNPSQLTDGGGTLARLVDFTQLPASSGPGQIAAGATWYFQFWYRDPQGPGGSGFNLSDGLQATFEP